MKLNILLALTAASLWTASAVAQAVDQAIWQGEAAAGPLVHRATNVAFPAEIEGFRRERVNAISPTDVAAGYRWKEGETETNLTVYLFRPGELPEHRLKGSVAAFGTLSPTAFVWSAGPFDVAAPTPLHGYKGVYKTGIGPGTLLDYLYFFELGQWTVKVRATIANSKEVEHETRIDSAVRALPWAQILAANGDCSGKACATPAFDAFDHHYTEAMFGRLLLTKMKFEPRKEKNLPVALDADLGLFKTAIRRSAEPPLLYVAEVKGMGTYRLVRLPDVSSMLITETFGKLSVTKPLYAIVFRMGNDDLMPRLFHGEPTPEAFGAAIEELLLHPTANPFVTVKETAAAMDD